MQQQLACRLRLERARCLRVARPGCGVRAVTATSGACSLASCCAPGCSWASDVGVWPARLAGADVRMVCGGAAAQRLARALVCVVVVLYLQGRVCARALLPRTHAPGAPPVPSRQFLLLRKSCEQTDSLPAQQLSACGCAAIQQRRRRRQRLQGVLPVLGEASGRRVPVTLFFSGCRGQCRSWLGLRVPTRALRCLPLLSCGTRCPQHCKHQHGPFCCGARVRAMRLLARRVACGPLSPLR